MTKAKKGSTMAILDAPSIGVHIDTEIREISPVEAQALMDKNSHNRNLRNGLVLQLSRAMKNGEWVFNGDAIRVGESGRLLDGQHRLAAVVESGVPQQFLIISGLPDLTQETMDSGAKRTVSDAMRLRGELDVNRLAAMTRFVWLYEQTESMRESTWNRPTTQQLLACLGRHPAIRESNASIRPVNKNTRFASGPAGACHYLFSLVDAADAEVFFTRLAQGTELGPRSPIHALRRRLTAPRNMIKIPSHFQAALAIKAFNMWRLGEETDHIRYNPGGSLAEKFPKIDGLDLASRTVT